MNWSQWEGARSCTGNVTPGARALQAWIDENYEGYSLGIYNCRGVRGSSATSMHSEGRALDWGLKMPRQGVANPVGDRILARLGAHGSRLGIQCVIWNRRIYSGSSPNGRAYTGVSPHYDHLHIELNWNAARTLTLATLRHVLGGGDVQITSVTPSPIEEDDDMPTIHVKPGEREVYWLEPTAPGGAGFLGTKEVLVVINTHGATREIPMDVWFDPVGGPGRFTLKGANPYVRKLQNTRAGWLYVENLGTDPKDVVGGSIMLLR